MRFHFMLDGLDHQHRDTLLSIESAMLSGPRSATAVFNLKGLDVFSSRDQEKAMAFVSGKLGAFHMEALESLLATTGLELIALYKAVKDTPVILKVRPVVTMQ